MMKRDLDFTDIQKQVVSFVRKLATKYNRKYMLTKIEDGAPFPQELWNEIAKAGYFGMIIPEKYGGNNLSYDDLRDL